MLGMQDDIWNSEVGPSEKDVFRNVDEYDVTDLKWMGVDDESISKELKEEESWYLWNFKWVLDTVNGYGNLFS